MNDFDKKLYKALNFFANNELNEIRTIQKTDIQKFRKNLAEEIENYAFDGGYLDADERKKYGITTKGLDQLRTLEGIIHNQKTFWISIIALIISFIGVIISIYFKGG